MYGARVNKNKFMGVGDFSKSVSLVDGSKNV